MKVYLITTDKFFVEENIIINALFEEGLDALHLRKPFSEPVLCERLLTLIPEKWHKKIVVHDHFYLKTEFDLKGIHLNERNPQPPANYKGHLSRTCYTLEEVSEWKKKCNYVFLTSVFENVNNENLNVPYSIEDLSKARDMGIIDDKVIALGCVIYENVRKTDTDVEPTKPQPRNYDFDAGFTGKKKEDYESKFVKGEDDEGR